MHFTSRRPVEIMLWLAAIALATSGAHADDKGAKNESDQQGGAPEIIALTLAPPVAVKGFLELAEDTRLDLVSTMFSSHEGKKLSAEVAARIANHAEEMGYFSGVNNNEIYIDGKREMFPNRSQFERNIKERGMTFRIESRSPLRRWLYIGSGLLSAAILLGEIHSSQSKPDENENTSTSLAKELGTEQSSKTLGEELTAPQDKSAQ